jgi:hypothetical protein
MNAIVLMTALLGQCGPNGCPGQPRYGVPTYQNPYLNLNFASPCGPNGCGVASKQATFQWVRLPDCTQYALYKDGVQQGNYDYEAKVYRPFSPPDKWGEVTQPPATPPETPAAGKEPENKVRVNEVPGMTVDEDGKPNFGVMPDPKEDRERVTHYEMNGKPATRDEVMQAFEDRATDQSGKLRLTVIGPRQARQAVLEDLEKTPDLQGVVKDFLLKDYDPNDWEVARSGFYTKGSPTIYVQAPSGKVLHRQDSYEGPADLASVLRKANDQYKAEADPNLSKATVFGLFGLPIEAWIVIGVGLYLAAGRKESNQ